MQSHTLITEPDENASDQVLVAAAQTALPAFEHLYRRYSNDVYRYCLRRLDQEADAADATSQVFIRALSNIRSCNPETFRSWLFAIARNVVIDAWRTQRTTVDLDGDLELADPGNDPEIEVIALDDRRTVLEILVHLTEEQRSVIELRLAGLTAVEIATLLGKSRNAIDQAQFRAVTRIRALLNPAPTQLEETAI